MGIPYANPLGSITAGRGLGRERELPTGFATWLCFGGRYRRGTDTTWAARRDTAAVTHRISESQHGGGWQGPLWVTQSNPLPKQGHPEQAAQHRVQAGLEYLQRRRVHSLPGQPGPGLRHPQSEEALPHVQTELPKLQFVTMFEDYEETERSTQSIPVSVRTGWALLVKSLNGGFETSFQLKAFQSSGCKLHTEHAPATEARCEPRK